jgi:hypothetical protein
MKTGNQNSRVSCPDSSAVPPKYKPGALPLEQTCSICSLLLYHLKVCGVRIIFCREIGWDGMDWIDLTQDRDQWRALVNTVMNLQVP